MKKDMKISKSHTAYIKKVKRKNTIIILTRFIVLFAIFGIWELFAYLGIIDSFITSSPSKIVITIKELFLENNLTFHIGVTLYETIIGFIISASLGYLISLLLWWSETLKKIFEPYLIVLNSLPKIALGPIIIVWFGSGTKSIIFMTVIIGIIVSIITMLNGFYEVDKNKILLLKSMGAKKRQIMIKLVIPSSIPTLISMLKINVGMAWIGSIMGEYLVSRAGLGYLIVYGGQVFKLDLVMASTVILCILAALMYAIVALVERLIVRQKN